MSEKEQIPIFYYVNIRPPQKISEQELSQGSIFLENYAGKEVISRISEIVSGHSSIKYAKTMLQELQKNRALIASKQQLKTAFPEYQGILDAASLNLHNHTLSQTLQSARQSIRNYRQGSSDSDIALKLIAESYILEFLINENPSLIHDLGYCIKAITIMNMVNPEVTEEEIEKKWFGQIILPQRLSVSFKNRKSNLKTIGGNLEINTVPNPQDSESDLVEPIRISEFVYNESTICEGIEQKYYCDKENDKGLLSTLQSTDPELPLVQVLGIGDLNVIKQKLLYYQKGEIAHIENLLKGEKKTRSNRELKRSEETYELETESIKELQTETTSSDRFEVKQEIANQQSKASQLFAGVNASYSYGPVSVAANISYAQQNANSQKSNNATNFNREVSNKAIERIQESIREKRTSKTITEVEKIQGYKLDNSQSPDDHVVGVYRFLDKVYENQVYNYGTRLKIGFNIPEPAAFLKLRNKLKNMEAPPIHPKDLTIKADNTTIYGPFNDANSISELNYQALMIHYGLEIIPPPSNIVVNNVYFEDLKSDDPSTWFCYGGTIKIQESGYYPWRAYVDVLMSSPDYYIQVAIHGNYLEFRTAIVQGVMELEASGLMLTETSEVPVIIRGKSTIHSVAIMLVCKPTAERITKWKIDIYNKVLQAYRQQIAEHEEKKALAGITIDNENPALNRVAEREELKKWCIEIMSLQRFDGFNAMKKSIDGHAEIEIYNAFYEGKFINFFEDAFDWENMTYELFDYIYGNKKEWHDTVGIRNDDPIHQKFLRAGAARTIVPVNPRFEKAVLLFLETMEIHEGNDELPLPNDEYYMSIINDIQQFPQLTEGVPIGDPVQITVPTNFVMLSPITYDPIPDDLKQPMP